MAAHDPHRRNRRSLADLGAFARAWGLLLAVDLALRAVSFARLERRLAPAPAGGTPDEETIGRLVWSVAAAARHHLYPMRCVPRALTLRWLLGRHGLPTVLKIGVLRRDGALTAHAWVERDGRAIGEPAGIEDRFAPLGAA